MSPRIDLSAFHPRNFLSTLEVVRASHPHIDELQLLPLSQILDTVRHKLMETSPEELGQLASNLSPKEMRAVLQLLALPEEEIVHSHGEIVLTKRPRKDLLRPAWNILLHAFPVRRVESVVRKLGIFFEWKPIGNSQEERARFERWFSRVSLESGILNDFIDSDQRDLDRWLSSFGIPEQSGLQKGIWHAVLTRSNRDLLMRLDHSDLLRRSKKEPAVIQDTFAHRYLETLESPGEWQTIVLEEIRSRCGVPASGEIQTAFWRKVEETVREKYRRWAIERTLKEYFNSIEDPHGRFEFWKTFLPHIKDAESPRFVPVAFIDFGQFGVVEFPHKGNAAYVYPGNEFHRIKAQRGSSVHAYKNKLVTLRSNSGPNRDGRILHYEGWQFRYRPWIEALLGVRSGRRGIH